ncbi:hypothetical protein EVAR_62933_1 [Eumeta japonica]|uniref:Nucleic-acid-binding protein from transposon X-element n=1 Tax=Eumeta variegata TaxID=151549 RepID=A0A4C2AHV6_EUMVA|nr:hypothetical protein EVAR_62933_1 [Eumeta japonica]
MPGDGVAVDRIRKPGDKSCIESLRTQNRHLSEVSIGKRSGQVCYRRRARNDLECHPVLEVSPELYHRLIKAGFVYVGLQRRPVWDQSPLVQCSRCLGYGHGKRFCKEVSERCAHCGGEHTGVTCRARKDGEPPKCVNCTKAGCEDTAHGAFSSECGVRAKWDDMARSKEPYIGNIGELRRYPRCRVIQRRLRGGTRQSRHNPEQRRGRRRGSNPQRRKRRSCRNQSRNCRIGVVSVYFEETCPSARTSIACDTSAQNSGPTKSSWGDVNAWSVWWGSERNDARGVDLCDFLDSEGCTS